MKNSIFLMVCFMVTLVMGCVKDEKPDIKTGESPVRINEAYSNGGRSIYGELDWVELYNTSDEPVNVGGFVLYDKSDKSDIVTIPANTTIAGHGFLLVEVDIPTGFGLGSGGDVVYLENAEGIIDMIEFGELGVNEAWAALPDGSDSFEIQTPTPDASNDGAVVVPSVTDVVHTPVAPTNEEAVEVTATVTPGEGTLSSVVLEWTLDEVDQTDIAMTADGSAYSAVIPAQAVGAEIAYSVVAVNSVGGKMVASGGFTVRDAMSVDYTGLVINEVDGNGKFVELYNGSAAAISLTGVKLVKNEESDPEDIWWTGGAVNIAAGAFYTIGQEGSGTEGLSEETGNGGISPKKNVKFELIAPEEALIDQFTRAEGYELDENAAPDYGSGTKYSFARCPDGVGAFGLAVPSCNSENPFLPAGTIVTEEADSRLTALVINEVDGNGKFVEIYNTTAEPISLEGVLLYKNLDSEGPWWIGGNVTIPAGGFYTIGQEGSDTEGLSEATGDGGISPKKTVRFDLVAPDGLSLDVFARVKADNQLDENCSPDYGSDPQYSFSRNPDGSGAFVLTVPSCNVANTAGQGAIVTE